MTAAAESAAETPVAVNEVPMVTPLPSVAAEHVLDERSVAEDDVTLGASEMTLVDLVKLDPLEKDRKAATYMDASKLKLEYVLRGVHPPKMNSHDKLGSRVSKLRKAQAKQDLLDDEKADKEAMFAGADYGPDDLHDVKDAKGGTTRKRFGPSEFLRLILVMVMPVNFMALTKYATGFHTDEKKRKRQELDDRPSYDPWQNEFKTAFNSDAQVNHPCPSHDTLGLAYADPNNCIVGWSGDQLKGFCSKIRSQISLVMVDWTASGNNDVDTLENFCEPSTDKRRNLSIAPKCLRVSPAADLLTLSAAVGRSIKLLISRATGLHLIGYRQTCS